MSDLYMKTSKEIKLYVGRTYKNSFDITSAMDALVIPTLQEPPEPKGTGGNPASKGALRIWDKQLDLHAKREYDLAGNVQSLYSLVWGQCSETMQGKVEAVPEFANLAQPMNDGIELLIIIKKVSFNFQSSQYLCHTIHETKLEFYKHQQGKYTTAMAYFESFANKVAALKNVKAPILPDEGIIKEVAGSSIITNAHCAEALEQYLATAFILGCDRNRYEELIVKMQNAYLYDNNIYPKTVNKAYELLTNWQSETASKYKIPSSEGVVFNNVGEQETDGTTMVNKGDKGKDRSTVTCYNCQQKGHFSYECTNPKKQREAKNDKDEEGTNMLINAVEEREFDDDGFVFAQEDYNEQTSKSGKIPLSWILLDNQSTVDVFSNSKLLKNI